MFSRKVTTMQRAGCLTVAVAVALFVFGLRFTGRSSSSPISSLPRDFKSFLTHGDGKGWNDDDDEDLSDRARNVWHTEFFSRTVNTTALLAAYPTFATAVRTPQEQAGAARAATQVADALEHVGVRFWLAHQTLLSSYRFAAPSSFSDPTPHFHIEPLSERWLQALGQLKPAWTIQRRTVTTAAPLPCNDAMHTSFTADGPIAVANGHTSPTQSPTLSCLLLKQEGGCTHSEYGRRVRDDCPLTCGICTKAIQPLPAAAAYDWWVVTLPITERYPTAGQVYLHYADRKKNAQPAI